MEFVIKCKLFNTEDLDNTRKDIKMLLAQREKVSGLMFPLETLLELCAGVSEVRPLILFFAFLFPADLIRSG
jgi:hypothetical protein